MKKFFVVGIAALAFAACATEGAPEQIGSEASTLTSDFGDVIVVGAQLPSGDNIAQAFLPEDLNNPVSTYQFSLSTGVASWTTGDVVGSSTEIPASESLQMANWMAYEVWAAGMGIAIGENPYGRCKCGIAGSGVQCTWAFN